MHSEKYPYLMTFSKFIGISPDKLVQAFEIERLFHNDILHEKSFERRLNLYSQVYNKVHDIYGKNDAISLTTNFNPKDNTVRLFAKELSGKSILEVGCGQGYFLAAVKRLIPHKDLMGLDVSIPAIASALDGICFKTVNIIDFAVDQKFDVVFSDQVIEHIAPQDLFTHLESIQSALNPNGLFIAIIPNRLFSPSDITRIIDFTNSGKTPAQGTHLNEMSYYELRNCLKSSGFKNFRTVVPFYKRAFLKLRFSPRFIELVERNSFLMSILKKNWKNGRNFNYNVTLICQKRV